MIIKNLFALFFCIALINCKTTHNEIKDKATAQTTNGAKIKLEAADATKFTKVITQTDFENKVYQFAADSMQGRSTGSKGQKKAAAFLKAQYQKMGIPSPEGIDYLQKIPGSFFKGRDEIESSENVIAFIEGSKKPNEYLVISAHYDHIGMDSETEIYNGADDNASGSMAILQIAKAMNEAKKSGNGPERSIVFLHVTGEEIGLYGSKYYAENPIFPLANTIADLNVDMIGRVDDKHKDDPNYIYLIGSDRLSNDLHNISEAVNEKYSNFNFDYTYNAENDPNRFYYRSDHYNFAKNNIPIIFYFNGVHDDYHELSDTADKINYELLTKRTKLIFYTAWELLNRKERPALKN